MPLHTLPPFRAWLHQEEICLLLQSQDPTSLDNIVHNLVNEALSGLQKMPEM